jgi:hypothetical protein
VAEQQEKEQVYEPGKRFDFFRFIVVIWNIM